MESPAVCGRHGIFRAGRTVFARHAAFRCLARQDAGIRAATALDRFLATLSFARAFAVPVVILEPVKPVAGYLVATGHLAAGAMTFVTGEVLKLTCVERLFELNRKKLLSIPAFAAGYRYWRRMMDVVESLEVWKAARRLANRAAQIVRLRWLQLKRAQASY
jgi:hypothetical protein